MDKEPLRVRSDTADPWVAVQRAREVEIALDPAEGGSGASEATTAPLERDSGS